MSCSNSDWISQTNDAHWLSKDGYLILLNMDYLQIWYISHYGSARLVLKIGEKIYQAEDHVEKNVEKLKNNCILKVEKTRVKLSTREKYAICGIYEFGDWTAMVEYTKTPMLRKFDGSTCIVDVKSVDIKGVKRKLLLTDNGTVYKLKRSRLEETVTPGFI